jgi:hypothetical protein
MSDHSDVAAEIACQEQQHQEWLDSDVWVPDVNQWLRQLCQPITREED